MATHQALSIANGFLELGFRDSVPIDPMKIQKLSFFAHGYYLASTGEPLIPGAFQAWPFGPVSPQIYEAFKACRSTPITDYAKVWNGAVGSFVPAAAPEDDPSYLHVRDFVWSTYGRRASTDLSDLTHHRGGAWDQTWSAANGRRNKQIDDAAIKAEFAPLIQRPN